MSTLKKVNDLTNSPLRKKFLETAFKPETNMAVAMCRVSTKGQKDTGHSDDAQRERIEEYITEEGLALAREPWDVAETAFKHDKRKNFLEMLNYVRSNPAVKHIIFSHQSRSNRNRESAKEIESLVKHQGVVLHCVRDNLKLHSQSPLEDWLRWDIFNALNEKSSADHKKNVMDGTIKRIELGLFPGKAPIGYKNIRPNENAESVFVIDETTAPFVKRAFELFATGRYSVARLIQELGKEFTSETFKGKKPERKYIEKMLKKPFYYGDFDYAGARYRGTQPPLISFELWTKAQAAFKQRGWKNKYTRNGFAYTGLTKCGGKILDKQGNETDQVCGCAVTGEMHHKKQKDGTYKAHIYWHCSNTTTPCSQRDRAHMEKKGLRTFYRQSSLETMFEEIFSRLHFTAEDCKWMQDVLLKHHAEESGKYNQKLSALHSRLKMLSRYLDEAFTEKVEGRLPEELWKKKNEQWRLERDQIKREIAAMDDKKDEYIEKGVLLIELAHHTVTYYKNAGPEKRRKLIDIVSSNLILKDGTLEYRYRKPFDILVDSGGKGKWWRR